MSGFWNILAHRAPAAKNYPFCLGIRSAGLCCAVGYHLDAAACAMHAHMDHFQESEFQTKLGHPLLVARLPETDLWGQARLARWLKFAIMSCLQKIPELDTSTVPLVWIGPEPIRTNGNDLDWYTHVFDQAVEQLGKKFHVSSAVLPLGRAGLSQGLEHAARLFSEGNFQYVLLAGADSYLDASTIEQYLKAERLQVPGNSDGFIPGEGAAAVLLHKTNPDDVGVHVIGFGEGQEPGRPDGSVPSRAQGLSQAVRSAMEASGQQYADLEFRVSDQNGEAFFAREAANAMTRVASTGGPKLPLITMADSLGEIGAATGLAMLAYLFKMMPHHSSPGYLGLLHLANDNGLRCAAILQCNAT